MYRNVFKICRLLITAYSIKASWKDQLIFMSMATSPCSFFTCPCEWHACESADSLEVRSEERCTCTCAHTLEMYWVDEYMKLMVSSILAMHINMTGQWLLQNVAVGCWVTEALLSLLTVFFFAFVLFDKKFPRISWMKEWCGKEIFISTTICKHWGK